MTVDSKALDAMQAPSGAPVALCDYNPFEREQDAG
jgi:hypothetical protein